MLKINLVAVGKVKEKYFEEGIKEYTKRLSRFCQFNLKELPEININNPSPSEIDVLIKKEGENILKELKGYVIVTDIFGIKFSSENLAKTILKISEINSEITFVIGGSYGVYQKVKEKADLLFSVSDLTFPHTLFRLMLSEQIYRAFTIINNVGYHK